METVRSGRKERRLSDETLSCTHDLEDRSFTRDVCIPVPIGAVRLECFDSLQVRMGDDDAVADWAMVCSLCDDRWASWAAS